ncbi:methyltransferase [Dulcicalothrix desertica PCC 7102]|uniref:Methyltransferase n=1 Tax=Dulcicalothrix desertica PCC 7102 TaxID=232991 RepID=A0A433UUY2_9CYAN|nr:class I SAM-dependent methyltransferase [Dulcicalothrix desertica]RUS97597.1 methyltransferase [Dulcicalothrix desertica PCC 7102]TWH54807.1 tRNA (cmo5U34)-methyltransferase [Dulcicalothrix desertica PCC 7102]
MDFNKVAFLPEAEQYHETAAHLVPGYASLYEIAGCYLSLNIPDNANILIVGAGGGMEIKTLAKFSPTWQMTGVDPSSKMLEAAKFWVEHANVTNQVKLIEGLISDVSNETLFDAVTCILVMHFLDEAKKIQLLQDIYTKLKPNGILVLADMSISKNTEEFDIFINLYCQHAKFKGESEEKLQQLLDALNTSTFPISGEKEAELITKAGFTKPIMFFSSLWFKAWFASKVVS